MEEKVKCTSLSLLITWHKISLISECVEHARQVTELLPLLVKHAEHLTEVLILLVPCCWVLLRLLLGARGLVGSIIGSTLPACGPQITLTCKS